MHLLDNIKRNIANLRFAVEFDSYDFTQTQQAALLNMIDELQKRVEQVESERVKV